jgi:hypothetical protein
VLGAFDLLGDVVIPILASSGIAWSNSTASAADLSNAYSFPSDGSTVAIALGVARAAKSLGCTNIGFVGLDLPIGHQLGTYLNNAMKINGGKATQLYFPAAGFPSTAHRLPSSTRRRQ